MHRKREIALHDEDPDESADDTEHGTRDDRVREQGDELAVVLEGEDVVPADRGDESGRDGHAAPPWS
ncbi:Uncharacterised protein [Mycobacterium tuberculosis]|nr:Uncharacterised protein [Mycobacterium tuberculosis]